MAEPVDGGVDGDGVEAAGAPLQRPHTSRCAQDLAQPDAAAGEQIATTSAFDGEADGDSLQSSQPREHADVGNSGYSQSSDGASAAVLSGQQPEHGEQRTEPETSVTAENIAARAAKMCFVGASEAVASGLPRIAQEPTKELVQLAAAHMEGMKNATDALTAPHVGRSHSGCARCSWRSPPPGRSCTAGSPWRSPRPCSRRLNPARTATARVAARIAIMPCADGCRCRVCRCSPRSRR